MERRENLRSVRSECIAIRKYLSTKEGRITVLRIPLCNNGILKMQPAARTVLRYYFKNIINERLNSERLHNARNIIVDASQKSKIGSDSTYSVFHLKTMKVGKNSV